MNTLYYSTSNMSCRRASEWFEEHEIAVIEKRIDEITKADLVQALFLSDNGFEDILKKESKTGGRLHKQLHHLHTLSFNEGVEFILERPEVLRTPLILGEKKLRVGYNVEEMRVFLSRSYRELEMG